MVVKYEARARIRGVISITVVHAAVGGDDNINNIINNNNNNSGCTESYSTH